MASAYGLSCRLISRPSRRRTQTIRPMNAKKSGRPTRETADQEPRIRRVTADRFHQPVGRRGEGEPDQRRDELDDAAGRSRRSDADPVRDGEHRMGERAEQATGDEGRGEQFAAASL